AGPVAAGRSSRGVAGRAPRAPWLAGLLAAAALLAASSPSMAQARDAAGDGDDAGPDVSLDLTGYVRSLAGVHDRGFDLPGIDRRSAFNSDVGRLKWSLRWGEGITVSVHDRLQLRVSSSDGEFGGAEGGSAAGGAGLGVSVVPTRSLDLETVLVDDDRVRLWHDIDRLAVTVRTDAADLTIGRQAITWGVAALFPVADLWARFSPFELDTEEKPGIDAVRALAYPGADIELDLVVADRGSWDDLSAGARATVGLASADVYGGFGKFWDRLIAMGGVTRVLDRATLRAEAAVPWSIDDRAFERLRATLGIDWLASPRLTLTAEYHHNGIGADDAGGYASRLLDPRVRRGETYFLGRHYLGGLASWTPDADGRLTLTMSALANLTDPSAALTPIVSYDLGRRTRISAGALHSLGDTPAMTAAPPSPQSEFGLYGTLGFIGASVFF
ncbi:MAG: hypothetical protein ACODAE_07005, partial [Gemmatimonadota bacterium]